MTGLLQQEEAFLQKLADDLISSALRADGYDCQVLLEAPAVLRKRAIRTLLPNPKPSMVQVEAVEQLLSRQNGSAYAELPGGFIARRNYDRLLFEQKSDTSDFAPVTLHPGKTVALENGMTLSLTGPVVLTQPVDNVKTFAIRFDSDPAVQVRPRQTGDTISLPGGRKTLKKWMIDRKIPAYERDLLPVLADEQGVIAVPGLACDETRKALPGETAWLLLVEKKEREYDSSNGHDAGH